MLRSATRSRPTCRIRVVACALSKRRAAVRVRTATDRPFALLRPWCAQRLGVPRGLACPDFSRRGAETQKVTVRSDRTRGSECGLASISWTKFQADSPDRPGQIGPLLLASTRFGVKILG